MLGDEIFYASVFPFWFWNVDGAVGRRIISVWALSMYIGITLELTFNINNLLFHVQTGQCLKDLICWVRPASPPVVRIEKKWALEYGMPSTHAMVSLTVPFSVILLTADRYEYPVPIGFAIAAVWCVLVSSSRLYLGMHSVAVRRCKLSVDSEVSQQISSYQDVVGGLLLAALLLPVLLPLVDAMDSFLISHPASPGLLVTTAITLMLLYPGSKFSSAKEDTAVILGSATGLYLGAWLNFQMGWIRGPPIPPPYPVLWPSYEMFGLTLLRTIIGLTVVVATRAVAKSLSYVIMKGIAVLLRKDRLKRAKEGQVSDLELFVKLGSKLITYGAIGLNVMCLAPSVFRYLDIERLTFHTEI